MPYQVIVGAFAADMTSLISFVGVYGIQFNSLPCCRQMVYPFDHRSERYQGDPLGRFDFFLFFTKSDAFPLPAKVTLLPAELLPISDEVK